MQPAGTLIVSSLSGRCQGVKEIIIDLCMLGLVSAVHELPMRKRSRRLTNFDAVVRTFKGFKCNRLHGHQIVEGVEGGIRRSVWAQVYPDAFARKLAICASDCCQALP